MALERADWIVRWIKVSAFVAAVVLPFHIQAATVGFCRLPIDASETIPCSQWYAYESSRMGGVVAACRAADFDEVSFSCGTDPSGNPMGIFSDDLRPDDWVTTGSSPGWVQASVVEVNGGFYIGGGGSGGGAFELDVSQAAEAFSVGFLLVASFFLIGKGVAVFIDLVRR